MFESLIFLKRKSKYFKEMGRMGFNNNMSSDTKKNVFHQLFFATCYNIIYII